MPGITRNNAQVAGFGPLPTHPFAPERVRRLRHDACDATAEDDFFHHKILGLGFLRHLGLGFLTTGTGDLAFRPGGTKAQIVYWPNVWNVQRVLARLEDMMAEREVV